VQPKAETVKWRRLCHLRELEATKIPRATLSCPHHTIHCYVGHDHLLLPTCHEVRHRGLIQALEKRSRPGRTWAQRPGWPGLA
jgi:hypothetical protein